MNKFISYLALQCIVFYQKWISPYKGFCCAYKHKTGGHSCSQYALKVVRRFGVWGLLRGLPQQFDRCHHAYLELQKEQEEEEKKKKEYSWCDCAPTDCGVGDCTMPKKSCSTGDSGAGSCDAISCDSLPCDAMPCDCSISLKHFQHKYRK
ncbi:MAG: membrane protein insertion efficiency factor YidD [Wohlfahrtiimonas sp.]